MPSFEILTLNCWSVPTLDGYSDKLKIDLVLVHTFDRALKPVSKYRTERIRVRSLHAQP